MKNLTAKSEEQIPSPDLRTLPPPIRLVQSFKESTDLSKTEVDSSDEALALEVLVIAGLASFKALSRLDDLYHHVIYGDGGSVRLVDRRVVEEGYDLWLDAADSISERLKALENLCYESESFAKFWTDQAKARSFLDDARERRRLERQAPRRDQLARLAAKLRPIPVPENVQETDQ